MCIVLNFPKPSQRLPPHDQLSCSRLSLYFSVDTHILTPHLTWSRSFSRRSSQPIIWLTLTNKTLQENTQTVMSLTVSESSWLLCAIETVRRKWNIKAPVVCCGYTGCVYDDCRMGLTSRRHHRCLVTLTVTMTTGSANHLSLRSFFCVHFVHNVYVYTMMFAC